LAGASARCRSRGSSPSDGSCVHATRVRRPEDGAGGRGRKPAWYDAATHEQSPSRAEARAVPTEDETLGTREGPVVPPAFNRPRARNAMTWGMYDRLYQVCEEVDADDSARVLVLRGAGGKAFVAGTDISQFQVFERAEDGIAYERDGDRRIARL